MSKRIELAFGGGDFDVVIDLVSRGRMTAYLGGEDFHSEFGGKQYYHSCSGASGAGFIQAPLSLVKCQTYRVDMYSLSSRAFENRFPSTIGQWTIYVPIDYRAGKIREDWPVVLVKNGEGIPVLVEHNRVIEFLTSQQCGECEIDVTVIRQMGGNEVDETLECRISSWQEKPWRDKIRKILESYNFSKLSFIVDAAIGQALNYSETNSFWSRLGLRAANDGRLYQFRLGLCRGWVLNDFLEEKENLEYFMPSNAQAIFVQRDEDAVENRFQTEAMYVQEGRVVPEAVYLVQGWENGQLTHEESFERELNLPEYLAVLAGNYTAVLDDCRGIIEKRLANPVKKPGWRRVVRQEVAVEEAIYEPKVSTEIINEED